METQVVANCFALGLAAAVSAVLVSLVSGRVRTALAAHAVPVAALLAAASTAGSLYFSEVAGFIPCDLCWYQRIAMYSLAVLLGVAAIWKDRGILRYARILTVGGFAVAAYHTWIQWFPEKSNFCELSNPCSAKWVEAFGLFTIPQMAALAFAVIAAVATHGFRADRASAAAPAAD